jgi:glycosyltransferase involved in cell wall biosynthesis
MCINDGSTDGSDQILDSYARYDLRFRVIHQDNMGVGRARNRGIREARGEFVSFLDGDDYLPATDTLRVMWEAAKREGVELCGGSFSEDHRDGAYIRTKFQGIYKQYTFDEDELIEYRDYQFDFGYHRFIYATEFLRENQLYFPDYIRFQDPPFFVRAMVLAGRFYALATPTYCYRWGHQKLSWGQKRTLDVLSGLLDNLRVAHEYGLDRLKELTWFRLTEEYRVRILYWLAKEDPEITQRALACRSFSPNQDRGLNEVTAMLDEARTARYVAEVATSLAVEAMERR